MSRRSRRHVRTRGKCPPTKNTSKPAAPKNRTKIQTRKKKLEITRTPRKVKKRVKRLKKPKRDVKNKRIMKTIENHLDTSVKSSALSGTEYNQKSHQNGNVCGDTSKKDSPVTENLTKDDSQIQEDDGVKTEEIEKSLMNGISVSHSHTTTEKTISNCPDVGDDKQNDDMCENSTQVEEFLNAGKSPIENLEVDPHAQSKPCVCPVCDQEMDSAVSLTLHVKQQHPNNQTHKCLLCCKSLSSASSLDRHMLVHSGERPFKCKICDMAFTTNGNMHRHMRTHGELADSNEVGKSIETKKKDIVKRKVPIDSVSTSSTSKKPSDELISVEDQEKLHCPVCGKTFLCKYGLQLHMETHPNDPILCQDCGEISSNYSVHVNHKCNMQGTKQPIISSNSSCGFHELSFMDFSTKKFSLVSKSFCEQNVKRPSSAFHIFECPKCKKSFPCGRALTLHKKSHSDKMGTFCPSCHTDFETPAFLQFHKLKHRSAEHCLVKTDSSDEVMNQLRLMAHGQQPHAGKEDFLALLELQTKQSQLSVMRGFKSCIVQEENFESMDYFVHGKPEKTGTKKCDQEANNDFADIQSIITLTSKAPLISDVQSSPVAVRPASPIPITSPPESPLIADSANASPETPSKDEAVQLVSRIVNESETVTRENNIYSCKVCKQTFKTINSLKRHNRLHIQRGSSYSCHLCSYVSVDKSTLIRHLRTHNGERPFQCVICKYAFTTKANCERHVRKRHKKFSKPEIRNFMQYNPNMSQKTPDITNTDINNSETVCKYCNVDFKFNRVLRHHLRSLHNSCNRKPFSCKICKLGFSTKNNCIRHVLKQHPNLKDKLRSVVIPNSHLEISDRESISTTENTMSASPVSNISSVNTSEIDQPLNLSCIEKQQTLNFNSERSIYENSSNEMVIAAESLVSLSEVIPPQQEPLDLAIHPLDLSCKVILGATQTLNSKPASIYSISSYSCTSRESSFLDLSTSKNFAHAEELSSSVLPFFHTINSINQSENISQKIRSQEGLSGQKLRSFTCIYCSAGFTLKSNMERHIKRKHPEFARPTRSRNFIPSVVSPSSQKSNIATLSDKTRDALRVVLSNKVHSTQMYKDETEKLEADFTREQPDKSSSGFYFATSRQQDVNCNIDQSLDLSANDKQENDFHTLLENCNSESEDEKIEDDNSVDLASVSAVICTANSQQFKQYLETSSVLDKNNINHEPENSSESQNMQTTVSSDSSPACVSCPFCSRKFPWTSSLRRHILTHTGQKPYKCPQCSLWFTTKSNCERHLFRKHGHKGNLVTRSVPERPYKCNQCPTSTFSTQGNLRKHFYLKHWTKSCLGMNSKPPDTEDNGDKTEQSENVHSDEKISNTDTVSVSTKEHSYSEPELKKCSSVFQCQFCKESFYDISDLSNHMHKHTNVIYMCYLCRKTFPRHDACLSHFKTSHSLVYMQIIQSEVTAIDISVIDNNSSENNSDGQEEAHDTSSSVMACMVCFKKLQSIEELQQHIKKHIQRDKYTCDSKDTVPNKSLDSCSRIQEISEKSTVNTSDTKKTRPKNMMTNSLLYLFAPPVTNITSSAVSKSVDTVAVNTEKVRNQEEDTDLIQNLLGIHDSKMIDEMLDSADSAARLLGVKEV